MQWQRRRSWHEPPPFRMTALTVAVLLLQGGQTAVDDLHDAVDLGACDAQRRRQHDDVRGPRQQASVQEQGVQRFHFLPVHGEFFLRGAVFYQLDGGQESEATYVSHRWMRAQAL